MKTLTIENCTLELTGAELVVIVNHLNEGVFRVVSPVLERIKEQIMQQQAPAPDLN